MRLFLPILIPLMAWLPASTETSARCCVAPTACCSTVDCDDCCQGRCDECCPPACCRR